MARNGQDKKRLFCTSSSWMISHVECLTSSLLRVSSNILILNWSACSNACSSSSLRARIFFFRTSSKVPCCTWVIFSVEKKENQDSRDRGGWWGGGGETSLQTSRDQKVIKDNKITTWVEGGRVAPSLFFERMNEWMIQDVTWDGDYIHRQKTNFTTRPDALLYKLLMKSVLEWKWLMLVSKSLFS